MLEVGGYSVQSPAEVPFRPWVWLWVLGLYRKREQKNKIEC